MLKYLFVPALAAGLVFGNDDVRVFVACVAGAFIALTLRVSLSGKMEPETRPVLQKLWERASSAAVVAALVYAGYPVLGAIWLVTWGVSYVATAAATAKAEEAAANASN